MCERNRAETLICINCPRGCQLTVRRETDADEPSVLVEGNACPRGVDYAAQEVLHPVRVLTCLMRPAGSQKPVSVRTTGAVPKERLLDCARQVYRTHPSLPIRRGDVLIEDLCGTGIAVIATRDAQ